MKFLGLLVSLFLCGFTHAVIERTDAELKEMYVKFVKQFYSIDFYNTTEEEFGDLNTKFYAFKKNVAMIDQHNSENHPWKMGINSYADWEEEETRSSRLRSTGYLHKPEIENVAPFVSKNQLLGDQFLPETVDWRISGFISPVRDQGDCGSCWAFGAVAQLESYVAIQENWPARHLSVQQLLSCSMSSEGGHEASENKSICVTGGFSNYAYAYASIEGIMDEIEAPYVSGEKPAEGDWPPSCDEVNLSYNNSARLVQVDGFQVLPSNDQRAVMHHLATVGPLSVAIDATSLQDFRSGLFYASGVFDKCTSKVLDHEVQLVGYGKDHLTGLDTWIIKNSWGQDWGMEGYMYLKRTDEPECSRTIYGEVCGPCGILSTPLYPINARSVNQNIEEGKFDF